MKTKTYLMTLMLFLLFFNGSILLVSVVTLKSNLDSTRANCLGEHTFITTALSKDLNAVASRGTTLGSALQPLFDSYVLYYGKRNMYLELSQGHQPLYSSLPEGEQLSGRPEEPSVGKRIIGTRQSQDKKYIVVSGKLSAPYDAYMLSYYYDLSELTATWNRMTRLLFLAGMIISALLAACLIMLLNRIFKPLRQISAASQNIAQGDYAGRLPIAGQDELADMAGSFNRMADAIEHQITRLADAAEQKQRFIDNFAHELRTPLTSIYGYAEYIQKTAITEADKLEATGFIMSESLRLQNIAYRLLDLASLRNGEIRFLPVVMKELLKSVTETLGGKASEKQVALEYDCGFEELTGDRDLLQSLLVNLTENAIKACEPGGKVKLKAFLEDGKKIIAVQDDGKGMTEEQMAHITEAFYRADQGRGRIDGGVGLGLSLCKEIAARHRAELSFYSQPGLGATAKISFTT